MISRAVCIAVTGVLMFCGNARAQHLWWNLEKQDRAVCLYGEITVLATHPAIYYCGANWHPGEAAGGYCGIQDNSVDERRTIFSIWDTSPTLHPTTTFADPKTIFNRFGGEGEGAHTHMLWDWKTGDTFQFFVRKAAGTAPGTTDAGYYLYDRQAKRWRHRATITCPNGGKKTAASVTTIGGGGLASFLENYLGKDRDLAKLALLPPLAGQRRGQDAMPHAHQGDGAWGVLHDAYFLAEGGDRQLAALTPNCGRATAVRSSAGRERNSDRSPISPFGPRSSAHSGPWRERASSRSRCKLYRGAGRQCYLFFWQNSSMKSRNPLRRPRSAWRCRSSAAAADGAVTLQFDQAAARPPASGTAHQELRSPGEGMFMIERLDGSAWAW